MLREIFFLSVTLPTQHHFVSGKRKRSEILAHILIVMQSSYTQLWNKNGKAKKQVLKTPQILQMNTYQKQQ